MAAGTHFLFQLLRSKQITLIGERKGVVFPDPMNLKRLRLVMTERKNLYTIEIARFDVETENVFKNLFTLCTKKKKNRNQMAKNVFPI